MTPIISAVILNWNGYSDTTELIESLFKVHYEKLKIVVVDNGSKHNDFDLITQNYGDKIHIISLKENLGFTGGNNVGIKYALEKKSDYILLLNNDTTVEPDFLNHLVNEMLQNKNVGIAVPKINYYENRNLVWYAGGYISKIRGSGFTLGEKDLSENYNKNKYVSFATGCCMLIKSNVFKNIQLFDENYFLYLEDVDYCKRCILAGYKILFVAKSIIYHKVSISAKKQNTLLPLYYVTRNRLYFVKKFYPRFFYVSFLFINLIFLFKSFFWLIKGDRDKIAVVKISIRDFMLKKLGKNIEL